MTVASMGTAAGRPVPVRFADRMAGVPANTVATMTAAPAAVPAVATAPCPSVSVGVRPKAGAG